MSKPKVYWTEPVREGDKYTVSQYNEKDEFIKKETFGIEN